MIAVAGMPRCGTTLLARAIAGLGPGLHWPGTTKGVCKTHVHDPRALPRGTDRAIFVFGPPLLAVISFRNNLWSKKSLWSFGVTAEPDDADLYGEDVLGLERMFDAWMGLREHPIGIDVALVSYLGIWEHVDEVAEFVSRKLHLPDYRERETTRTDISNAQLARAIEAYSSLIIKAAAAPTWTEVLADDGP